MYQIGTMAPPSERKMQIVADSLFGLWNLQELNASNTFGGFILMLPSRVHVMCWQKQHVSDVICTHYSYVMCCQSVSRSLGDV